MAIDPDTIELAVWVFQRYAVGTHSIEGVASEFGLNDRRVNEMLKNPIYNGLVGRKGERAPAPWRDTAPVDDLLRGRVQALEDRLAQLPARRAQAHALADAQEESGDLSVAEHEVPPGLDAFVAPVHVLAGRAGDP